MSFLGFPLGGDVIPTDDSALPFDPGGADTFLEAAVTAIVHMFTVLIGAINAVLVGIGHFVQHLWDNFFKKILQDVLGAIRKAQQWLEQRLRPVIRFLQRLRALQQQYFVTYLKPILDMLQRIRGFLQVLRLLHIQFAAQLDNYIAGLEARLVQNFATITAAINTLLGIAQAITDPNVLLKKPALLLSIRRQIPALIAVVTGKPPGYWFPSPRGAAGGHFAPVGSGFNPSDPLQNPPPSSYLGSDDGIPGGLLPDNGLEFTEGSVDQASPLDYFDDALYSDPVCQDAAQCLDAALQTMLAGNV